MEVIPFHHRRTYDPFRSFVFCLNDLKGEICTTVMNLE